MTELAQMESAFMRGSQLEYMFWDAAYRLEEWPVYWRDEASGGVLIGLAII